MRATVLVNATSGTAVKALPDDLRQKLADHFSANGIVAELEMVEGDALIAAAQRAKTKAENREIDTVIVGGGDGTISSVAAVLAGTKVPLGILPLGTLNHFAKDAGIPLGLEDAIALIATASPRAVDRAEANGRIFVNNSSIGMYPHMVVDRERRRRRSHINKWAATILSSFHMVRRFPLTKLRVRTEEGSEPCRTPCLFVGNNKYDLNLLSLGKRESLDAGELWLYISKHQTRLSLFWFTLRTLLGLADPASDLRMLPVKHTEITAKKNRLFVTFDGEIEIMRPPLRYKTRPGALYVYAPPSREKP